MYTQTFIIKRPVSNWPLIYWLPGQDSVTTVGTSCFSLRNLPFGFLTQHVREAFPPTWSAESSLRVPQRGILANKKAHAKKHGPFVCWLPGQDSVTTVETSCFSLRNLPFGFLTQHVREAFPPTWSAESSLRVPQRGNLANKKAHAKKHGPFVCWLPGQDSNLQPSG